MMNHLRHVLRVVIAFIFIFTAPLATHSAVAAEPPHVVIIVADDLGWADVGYHGGPIRTPHLDRLAKEGVELDRFYVCPMCSPTRAGLMTGRYPIRMGMARAVVPPWRDDGLDTSEVTLPEALAKAGYKHRGAFGKWHLGHLRRKWLPTSRGFTHFHGHYNGAIDYFTHEREGETDWHINEKSVDEEGYATDLIADAASRFIRKHADDGPLLVYVPFNAPHSPFQAPAKYLEQYEQIDNRRKRTLAAMITCMDDGIGRILKAIDDAGIRENTLVWFFSDNGGVRGVADNNLPLRGDKLSVFEGGIRVPALLRWPAGIKGGRKVTAPLTQMDVMPTLMKIAGVTDHGGKPLDGRDVTAVLRGEEKTLDRTLFFYHGQQGPNNEHLAVITPRWKLIVLGPDVRENDAISDKHQRYLFRIADDPHEKTNVAAEHADVVKRLIGELKAFRAFQPADAIPPYGQGRRGFTAPKDWRIERE